MNPAFNTTFAQQTAPGEALSIDRFFTRAGVHPFDTVEWELRDARIGHGDHVAFEQTDVEFPASWSQNATNIVAQKYFRGQLSLARARALGQADDRPRRRHDRRLGPRAAATSPTRRGRATPSRHELTHILLHQLAAFNSPVWFNVGFEESPQCSRLLHPLGRGHDGVDPRLEHQGGDDLPRRLGLGHQPFEHPRLDGAAAEGRHGVGPRLFMRGADAWAGTIKSGGKTRRAAKMVVLDVDHPDIREFIWCKAKEEDKAAALRDAGFDMSIDGDGFQSIQYQNANNSVRVTDEFMQAVEDDGDWRLIVAHHRRADRRADPRA